MSILLRNIGLAATLAVAGCGSSSDTNFGYSITVVDSTMNGTRTKAMLVVDKNGLVECSKGFDALAISSKVHQPSELTFQQIGNNPAWQTGAKIRITRTDDKMYTLVYDEVSRLLMLVENKSGNGTIKFEKEESYQAGLKKCKA